MGSPTPITFRQMQKTAIMVRPLYRYSLVSARPSAWSPQRTNTKGVLHSHSRNRPPAACSAQGQERPRKHLHMHLCLCPQLPGLACRRQQPEDSYRKGRRAWCRLVDAWSIPDYLLDSALGRFDGEVYPTLFKSAHERNPLNVQTFNSDYRSEEIILGEGEEQARQRILALVLGLPYCKQSGPSKAHL